MRTMLGVIADQDEEPETLDRDFGSVSYGWACLLVGASEGDTLNNILSIDPGKFGFTVGMEVYSRFGRG